MASFDESLGNSDRNHEHAKIVQVPDGKAGQFRIGQRPQAREDQKIGNNEKDCADTDPVAGKLLLHAIAAIAPKMTL